jgi:hypothetical protein
MRPSTTRRGFVFGIAGGVWGASALGRNAHAQRSERPNLSQMRADLAVFRDSFLALDRSYLPEARTEAEARVATLAQSLDRTEQANFLIELSRIAALADNGHTNVAPGTVSRLFNRVNLRFSVFGEDYYVLRARDEDNTLLGSKLVAINNHAIMDIRREAHTLFGGRIAFRDRFVPYVIESPQILHALGMSLEVAGATFSLRTTDGRVVERTLAGAPPSADRARVNSNMWLYPTQAVAQDAQWTTALPLDRAPWSLQDLGQPFRLRVAP